MLTDFHIFSYFEYAYLEQVSFFYATIGLHSCGNPMFVFLFAFYLDWAHSFQNISFDFRAQSMVKLLLRYSDRRRTSTFMSVRLPCFDMLEAPQHNLNVSPRDSRSETYFFFDVPEAPQRNLDTTSTCRRRALPNENYFVLKRFRLLNTISTYPQRDLPNEAHCSLARLKLLSPLST